MEHPIPRASIWWCTAPRWDCSPDDPLPFDARLRPDAAVVDILMKPEPTPLQRACERRGITCSRASRC
jgi:shikimate 5-dehydrogenase